MTTTTRTSDLEARSELADNLEVSPPRGQAHGVALWTDHASGCALRLDVGDGWTIARGDTVVTHGQAPRSARAYVRDPWAPGARRWVAGTIARTVANLESRDPAGDHGDSSRNRPTGPELGGDGNGGGTAPHRPEIPTVPTQPAGTATPADEAAGDATPLYHELVHRAARVEYGIWRDATAKAKGEGRGIALVVRLLLRGYLRGEIKV